MKGFVLTAVLAAVLAYTCQTRMNAHPPPVPERLEETLPTPEVLRWLAAGYDSLWADYYWLRAISNFGTKRMAAHKYPNLIAFTERVLELDPWFATAYFFAGTALTVSELDPRPAIRLLKQGMRYRPDDWRIPFLLGFNAYYFLGDYQLGAEALAKAALLPGAPEQAGPLAVRLAAEAGAPEVGLALIESLLATVTDPELRAMYEERQRLLLVEQHLQWLNQALAEFAARQGRPARSLEELVQIGLLTHLPEAPAGGRYVLGPEGQATTAEPVSRLRIYGSIQGTK